MNRALARLGFACALLSGCAVAPRTTAPTSSLEPPPAAAPPLAQPDVRDRSTAASPTPVPPALEAEAPPTHIGADALIAQFAKGLRGVDCARIDLRVARPHTPATLSRALPQALPLFGYVLDEIDARGLPHQLALLPLQESGYRADPGNRGSFQGLWQFSAATARRFGLVVGKAYDARYSVVESTDAALRHLSDMWQQWQDWRLVVIGYNAGEYAVQRALRRAGAIGPDDPLPPGLPLSSRNYVRRIAALSCLLADPARHAITLPSQPVPILQRVPADGAAPLTAIAQASGHAESELRAWNPQLRHAGAARRSLLLPRFDSTPRAAEQAPIATVVPPPREPRWHRVEPGDSLWRIARRHGVTLRDLIRWNLLDPKAVLRPGQRLKLEP